MSSPPEEVYRAQSEAAAAITQIINDFANKYRVRVECIEVRAIVSPQDEGQIINYVVWPVIAFDCGPMMLD